MADIDDDFQAFIAHGGICSLFVDDHFAADRASLEAFLSSSLPGVVIPTSGFSSARLVCGQRVVQGNDQILSFLERMKTR